MLEYNPIYRPSASRLIGMNIFDDIRVPQIENWHEQFVSRFKKFNEDYVVEADDLDEWRHLSYQRDSAKIQLARKKLLKMATKFKQRKSRFIHYTRPSPLPKG